MAFDRSVASPSSLAEPALAQLFTEARTRNGWTDRPVPEALIRQLYDLTKFGPTAVNSGPARFVFVTSAEAKARLDPLMSEGNRAKTLQAPVTVIIGHDLDFHEHLPTLRRGPRTGSPTRRAAARAPSATAACRAPI